MAPDLVHFKVSEVVLVIGTHSFNSYGASLNPRPPKSQVFIFQIWCKTELVFPGFLNDSMTLYLSAPLVSLKPSYSMTKFIWMTSYVK